MKGGKNVQIKNVKINGFGNLEKKEIELDSGINLICGNNERGKSTFLKFIQAMFYGISKGKAGKQISDSERYTPWYAKEFSGNIKYKLDDGQEFQVFRDFSKKNLQILNDKHEDISDQYEVEKNRGNLFFKEQTKMDEDLFCSTVLVAQGQSKLDKGQQSGLIQKLTNILSTGKDNISYQKTVDKLNKKLIEEVGTERSSGRPINIVKENISKIKAEIDRIGDVRKEKQFLDKEKSNLEEKLDRETSLLNLLKQVKTRIEKNQIEKEKIRINREMRCKTRGTIKNYSGQFEC